ncbi:hypothetical protein ACNY9Y_001399 [Cronobacter dublinensis]
MREEIKALGKKQDETKIERIREKYKSRLEFKILIDKTNLLNMLQSFNEIKSAAFKFDSVDFKEAEMIGVEQFTRNTEVVFNISDDNKGKVQQVAAGVEQLFNKISGIKKGVVTAVDHDKNERFIDLINSPCFFKEYEFDTLAQHVDGLKNDNYINNEIVCIIKDEIENGSKKNEFI